MSGPSHPSLKDVAADYISERIVNGEFAPGSKVAQDEVAEELGISRLPVREALIELGEKGYVTTVPRRGVFVVELAPDDIEDHFEVLGAVFAIAARRAAAEIADDQLQRLDELDKAADATRDRSECEVLNREFNQIVNRVASSSRLLSILQSLSGALPGGYYLASPDWETTEGTYRKRMLAALRSGASDEAAAVAMEHLNVCGGLAVEQLQARLGNGAGRS